MASRVNTRFVVLLTLGVIVLLGLVVVAYSVVMKSASDLAAKGDEFMQQGNFKQAEFVYSKAVNKDSSNIEYIDKWISSLEQLIPETETEYTSRFYTDYRGVIRQAATVLRDDIDAHERSLDMTYQIMSNRYNRSYADSLIEETTSVLSFFDRDMGASGGAEVAEWERLKRFRGIAIAEIARHNGVLEEGQLELGIDDLERAIGANPDDTESLVKLLNLRTIKVDRETPEGQSGPRIEVLQESAEALESALREHPDELELKLQLIRVQIDLERNSIDPNLSRPERVASLQAIYKNYRQRLSDIASSITSSSTMPGVNTIEQYSVLEQILDAESRFSRTRRILDVMIENDRENADLLYYAGSLANEAGDFEEAYAWFDRVRELGTKPLSIAGMRQFWYQRQSILTQAEIRLQQSVNTENDEDAQAMLDQARTLRNTFAAEVQEDDLQLMMLDGKFARAEGQNEEALRLFKRYNEQTQRNRPEGLWFEGLTASQLGQYGVAQQALEQLITFDSTSRRLLAMMTLAQIHEQLKEFDTAAKYYEEVLSNSPNYALAQEGLDKVNRLINPELNEDPALEAIYTARRMRQGSDEAAGDYAGAVQYLRESVERLNYEPRVARELASQLIDNNDVAGARALMERTAEIHPDSEPTQSMLSALKAENPDEILIKLIRESDRPELNKLLSIARIASTKNMPELLEETVRELNQIAPDDKSVIEMTFVDAMQRGDIDLGRTIAQNQGLTPVESLSYQARIAVAEQQPDKAIDLLKQAAASGLANASVYQMLGMLQRDSGRMNEALATFEEALEIRPDQTDVIREYVITMVQAQQYEQALSTARRLQRYGTNDPVFMNLWLNLEAQFGGTQGREFAGRQRERMLELNPGNMDNAYQLARLYIQSRKWNASRALIDQLRSTNDRLEYVELDATWHADQGTIDGRSGIVAANEVFSTYINSLPAPVGPEPYMASSQFMLSRGRPDLALAAANEAVKHQSPDTMLGTVLLGDLQMRVNNFAEAVKAFREVVDAGADNEDYTVRSRLIETLVRVQNFQEAQEVYDGLPDSKRREMITMLQGADIAVGLGDTARANNILDSAVAAYPNQPLVYIKRAELMIGDETLLNDMLSDIERALDLDSENWRAYRVRAAGFFAIGRQEEALDNLKTAVQMNPLLDRSIYSLLNELLTQPNREDEAAEIARDIISRRADDANLISRIAGLFASRDHWDHASDFYGMAWNKRRAVADGATYIDSLVRRQPPDAATANQVITELAKLVGDINQSSGLLAAQALVLQARGRDDFAQQQITKAFDISLGNDSELLNWSVNLSRFFEGRPASEHIAYLNTLKRRNTNPRIGHWLNYFIANRMLREDEVDPQAYPIIESLKGPAIPEVIRLRTYRMHGTSHFNHDEFEQAAQIWRSGLEEFSDDWEMNNNLAYVLSSKLGRPEEALSYAEKAISKNQAISEPYETMAGIYIALGKYDEADQMIKTGSEFINSIPARIAMQITSARLAMKRGDIQEARTSITGARSVLRSAPTSYPELEQSIDEFEAELNSGEN
ncbi:MAG: tetratricopeptide repeat protein [Phycisphaerales bacterium JB052]